MEGAATVAAALVAVVEMAVMTRADVVRAVVKKVAAARAAIPTEGAAGVEEKAGEEQEICDCICTTVGNCRCSHTGRSCHSCGSSNTGYSGS